MDSDCSCSIADEDLAIQLSCHVAVLQELAFDRIRSASCDGTKCQDVGPSNVATQRMATVVAGSRAVAVPSLGQPRRDPGHCWTWGSAMAANGAGEGSSVADRGTDSIPAAQGSPPAWRWNDMLLSQGSDSDSLIGR